MAKPSIELTATALDGVLTVQSDLASDPRGVFYRTWCKSDLAALPIEGEFVQSSISVSRHKGTLRGLHFQLKPSREGKLVRCVGGEIFDVAVDVRPESPHLGESFSTTLKAHDGKAVFIPHGFAHGFQALTDDAAILYMMTDYFAPDLAGGIRWDDPALGIDWPLADPMLNERDANYPTLGEMRAALR